MIEVVLLVLFLIGIVTLWLPAWQDLWFMLRRRLLALWRRFRNDDAWLKRQEQFRQQVPEHIRHLLHVTLGMGTKESVWAFFLLSAALGCLTLVTVARRIVLPLAVAAAVCACLLPYLLLRCMIQRQRVAGSHEGEILVTELLDQYRLHYHNMREAIEQTALTIEEAPYCRRLLLDLSRGLNTASTGAQIRSLTEEFRFAIGTAWAGILAMDVQLACESGLQVEASLADLAHSLTQARQLEEYNRRENNEARLILRYLIPVCGLLMVGGAGFFGLSVGDFFHYQFGSAAGLTWWFLWLVSYLAAIGVYLLLSKRKLDM